MKFTEIRVLHIRYAPACKAEYHWKEENSQWRYYSSSTPSFFDHDIPTAFTEEERLLFEIKFSGNDR